MEFDLKYIYDMSDNSLTTNDLLIQSMIPVLEFVNFEISFICMLRIPMQR